MVKDQQEAQAMTLVVVWFLEAVVVVTIQHRPHREKALLIAIDQVIRPVPVSVPKLLTRPLGRVVLLVTARLFVVHLTLQKDHPLSTTTKPGSSTKKGIAAASSVGNNTSIIPPGRCCTLQSTSLSILL